MFNLFRKTGFVFPVVFMFVTIWTPSFSYGEENKKNFLSVEEVLKMAYFSSPSLKAREMRRQGAYESKKAQSWLSDPMIGYSTLNRNMETGYLTISQKIDFPTKYYYKGRAANNFAKSMDEEYRNEKFEVRRRALSTYYEIYSTQKIIELTIANMETVREVARVAEKKYASGRGSQSDTMRAHLELTALELDLMSLNEKEKTLQQDLKGQLNNFDMFDIDFRNIDLETPFRESNVEDTSISPKIKIKHYLVEEARANKSLGKLAFMPDFEVRYQKRISGEPRDSDIFSVAMTIPLWFWKTSAYAKNKSMILSSKEMDLIDTRNTVTAKTKSLLYKIDVEEKTIKVYVTSLIPQALGAFNSTKAAYKASKAGFADLLDSERLFYKTKQGFYKSLSAYVKKVTRLEALTGREILKFKKELEK